MNIGCQSIINPERPMQGVIDLRNAGFETILLGISAHFPQEKPVHKTTGGGQDIPYGRSKEEWLQNKYSPETIGERYGGLIDKCRENHIRISAVSVPCIPHKKAEEKNYSAFIGQCALEGLRLCSEAGCGYIVIPPLQAERGNLWGTNRKFYLRFAKTAEKYGVRILLKNQCREYGGRFVRGNCAEASQAVEWIDRLNCELGDEIFGLCLDIGVCGLCGNDIHEYILEAGKRIKMVVLRDCNGQRDRSFLPFACADSGTDWLGMLRGLRKIGFDGELIIDFSDTMRAFSPLLRPALYNLAREAAKYFEWQIGLEQNMQKYQKIVLFGAGNMCRNYMKNYGDQYPPQFTCDNNPKLWGTKFCGLEVKRPEALKELPDDCGIFICNMYYREIEEQLRVMGIEKNVEYFNDEYMPSFYFDRVDLMERD